MERKTKLFFVYTSLVRIFLDMWFPIRRLASRRRESWIIKINCEELSKLITMKAKIPTYYFRSFFLRAVALLKYAENSPPAEISRLSKKGKQFFRLLRSRDGGSREEGEGRFKCALLFLPFLILLE